MAFKVTTTKKRGDPIRVAHLAKLKHVPVHNKKNKSKNTAYVSPLITHQAQLTLQKIRTKNVFNKRVIIIKIQHSKT
jgi:hypothetical protein